MVGAEGAVGDAMTLTVIVEVSVPPLLLDTVHSKLTEPVKPEDGMNVKPPCGLNVRAPELG